MGEEKTREIIEQRITESIRAHEEMLKNPEIISGINNLASVISTIISNGGKLLICGNGGSASDAMHIAGELVGRFQKERPGFAAIALNCDTATITAISNDYGYEYVFSRQVEGIMNNNDILLGISTSGNSANIVKAVEQAKAIGGVTAVLTGKTGGVLKEMTDISIIAPGETTARIQECHLCIYHTLCEIIESILSSN